MKKDILSKTLVIGIIFLFVGVSVYPTVAEELISIESYYTNEEKDAKDYLFQTLIDVVNNPSVKKLLEQSKDDLRNVLNVDFNSKNIFKNILFKNPGLIFNMLFIKPSLSHEYLNRLYDQGIELFNIIGEDEALMIVESVHFDNQVFYNDFNNIIENDKILSNKFSTLEEMNEINPKTPQWPFPIICTNLLFCWLPFFLLSYFLLVIDALFGFIHVIDNFVLFIINSLLAPFIKIFVSLAEKFGCFWT